MDVLVLNNDMMPVNQLPLSTIKWQDAIRASFLETVVVIAEYDDWEVHSPSLTMRVPSIIMSKRNLHFQRKIAFTEHNLFLRDRYTCQYCLRVFPEHKLTMDHVTPRKYGGKTTWDNISAACSPCNSKRGHNQKIRPNKMPHKPSYYELLAIRKDYPLAIPCEQWIDFLDWPKENLFVKDKEKKILRLNRVA